MPHKTNQKGFAALEAVLIVIIVALIAGVGYYVWHANRNVNNTLNAAAKSAQNSPSKSSKSSVTSYLVVKEWGVKIPIDASTKGLSHVEGGFTSDNLKSFCTSQEGGMPNIVLVSRGRASDLVPNETNTDERTFAQFAEESPHYVYANIAGYYYVEPDFRGASCTTNAADSNREGVAQQAIQSALKKMIAAN